MALRAGHGTEGGGFPSLLTPTWATMGPLPPPQPSQECGPRSTEARNYRSS